MGSATSCVQDSYNFSEENFIVESEAPRKIKPVKLMNHPKSYQYFDETSKSPLFKTDDSNYITKKRANNHRDNKLSVLISLKNSEEQSLFMQQLTDLLGERGQIIQSKYSKLSSQSRTDHALTKKSQFYFSEHIENTSQEKAHLDSSSSSGPEISESLGYDDDSFEENITQENKEVIIRRSLNLNKNHQIIICQSIENPPLYKTKTKSIFYEQAAREIYLGELQKLEHPSKLGQRAASLKVESKN